LYPSALTVDLTIDTSIVDVTVDMDAAG